MTHTYTAILLTKLRYIGDVLLTTPAIRTLRNAYPRAHITMVVNKGTEDVIRHNPHVNRILTVERRPPRTRSIRNRVRRQWDFVRALRNVRYDLSIDFASGDRAAYLSLLAGAPLRVGFTDREGMRRWIFNRQVDVSAQTHTVERNLILVHQALGLPSHDKRLELYTGGEDDEWAIKWLEGNGVPAGSPVVIHPGARFAFKRWPADKWPILIDLLQGELGCRVVLAGGSQEAEEAGYIVSRARTPVLSLVGQTTVLQLAALLKRARLFVGNDSGPMHLAAAVGVRVIGLFGPTEPAAWGPWGAGHVAITKSDGCTTCATGSCDRGKDNCMERISVEEVTRAVKRFLTKTGADAWPSTPCQL